MRKPGFLVAAAILISLSGCDTNKGPIKAGLGNAVQNNMAVHIVNPRVPKPGARAPEMEGERAFRALDRYRRGDVEKLNVETTSKTSGEGN